MTREEAEWRVSGKNISDMTVHNTLVDLHNAIIEEIFNDHEAIVKAKDEEIATAKMRHKLEHDRYLINEKIIEEKDEEIERLKEAMQEFVDRCEKGKVRSKYTYSKFKELLKDNK